MSEPKRPDIKRILNDAVSFVCSEIDKYAENPEKDFTRDRKLPADKLINLMLDMEGNSLNAEIYNNFPDAIERPTASAYEQQRDKLKPEAFLALLNRFNRTLEHPERLKGLRVYAVDGSDFCTPRNKNSEYYIPNHYIKKDGGEAKGTCLVHGNFLFDILNKQYMDVNIGKDERGCAIKLMENISYPQKSLVIADRGYSGYNMIEHGNRYGGYYCIRFPLTNTIKEIMELPNKPCDRDIEVKVSTKSQQFCNLYGYRKLQVRKPNKEYSENTSTARWDFEDKCTVKFRVCKFHINTEDSGKQVWEILVTNLPRDMFSLREMKKLYHLRWGIETSFLELKYALGAINFHSKKDKFILQELYAHLVMFNAVARVAAHIRIKRSESGYAYAVDFKMVVHIFRIYFRHFNKAPPNKMYADMEQYRHILKDGRHNMRLLKPKSAVWFTYRVA